MITQSNKAIEIGPLKGLQNRKSLGEHVFETLRQAIIRGDMIDGVRMVESRIASGLGISRTPVREALHKLEREGLVRKLPRGGFVVLGFNRRDIEEIFGIRAILESYAARLATEKHTPSELETLENKIEAYQLALDQGHIDVLPAINTEFHDQLYAMSRSPRLIGMINSLRDSIHRFREIILQKEILAHTSNADHRRMLVLMRARDAEAVEVLVRSHILRGQDAVLIDFDVDQETMEP